MADLAFRGELTLNGKTVSAGLELYKFKEEGMTIIYCPALDLSAYGEDERSAKKSFSETFRLYVTYCLNKNTLIEDLKKYGWAVKSLNQKHIKAPTTQKLLEKSATLREIVYRRNYEKISRKEIVRETV